jgi:dolichol-phosphate mannosyltransferase
MSHTLETQTNELGSSTEWQVPAYRLDMLAERAHEYCVIIPVINEGQRIADLLGRMNQIGTPALADIIIVDGGSTDGSLELSILKSYGVRTLITKTGPGKLSAQLRCGYAYAIQQGYAGFVTIDGNNKDDPQPIGDFIEALRSGVDFIQASHFIPGGVAETRHCLDGLPSA